MSMAILVLALLACRQDGKPARKIDLKGCMKVMKVEGISFKQGQTIKYSVDTYPVRIRFTNQQGDAYQRMPVLNFVLYNVQAPHKKVQSIVTKEQWKTDASKIKKDTVADPTIAWDK